MGSWCAPAVACTYMAKFERLYIHNLTNSPPKPSLWLRFIDDIFCLWPHGEAWLHEFTNYLNSRHPRIKFTCSFSTQSIEFLDTKVYIEDNTLKTSLFIKPTSSLAYLKRSSCHPIHVFCHCLMVNFFGPEEKCMDNSCNSTKPVSEPMLNNYQWSLIVFPWWQFHHKFLRYLFSK